MARYFAEIDAKGTVLRVIVAEPDFIESGIVGDPAKWIETKMDGSARKNYAGIGFTYDKGRDAFIAPKPFPSFLLNEELGRWEAPLPYPKDTGKYVWDEDRQNWVAE